MKCYYVNFKLSIIYTGSLFEHFCLYLSGYIKKTRDIYRISMELGVRGIILLYTHLTEN